MFFGGIKLELFKRIVDELYQKEQQQPLLWALETIIIHNRFNYCKSFEIYSMSVRIYMVQNLSLIITAIITKLYKNVFYHNRENVSKNKIMNKCAFLRRKNIMQAFS